MAAFIPISYWSQGFLNLLLFVDIKYIKQCQVLNTMYRAMLLSKINFLLYSSVFKEKIDDKDFNVEHTVQLLNWIHFRI